MELPYCPVVSERNTARLPGYNSALNADKARYSKNIKDLLWDDFFQSD